MKHPFYFFMMLPLILIVSSCTKADISFSDNTNTSDPDIVYYDNFPVTLSTWKTDSFITSGHSVMTAGYHRDPVFGNAEAACFTELSLPSENPLQGQNVLFDSLVIVLEPKGYYGDTTLPARFIVNKLTERIRNTDDENNNYYNTRSFGYESQVAGERSVVIRPGKDTAVTIRLNDVLGLDLFQKLKTNAPEIRDQSAFTRYLNGFRIGVDTNLTRALYYFNITSDSLIMRLCYRLNGTVYQEKTLDFRINPLKQFNYMKFGLGSTALSVFSQKKELKESSSTAHHSFLHSNLGTYIKMNFPTLLSLKELHPYIQIMKAELVIRPTPGTYSYPYQLPSALNLYTTDESNYPVAIVTDGTGQSALNGSLYIDKLYGTDTRYSYEVTSFIKKIISEGVFSKSALLLVPPSLISEGSLDRLVINDQDLNNGIQLKLYVLGL